MKKRQSIRKGILVVSFILFPLMLFWFSPYTALLSASKGIIGSSLTMFSFLFIISLFTGRIFSCAYSCPIGGMQECIMIANNKKVKGGKLNFIKYFFWVPWITTIIIFFILADGIKKFIFFFGNENGFNFYPYTLNTYIIYYGFVLGVAIISFIFGRRAFCHYLCFFSPFMIIGRKLSNFLKIPHLQLKSEKEKCVGCEKCSEICPMSLNVKNMVKNEKMYDSECSLCGECIDICPQKAILYSFNNKREN